MGAIVVGVDGSDESRRALDWALAWARVYDAPVRVVHAYAPEESPREADLIANAEVKEARTEGVEVQVEAVPGHAVRVLLEAARDADLLVVGTRGRGRRGFPGLLLGSVSRQLATNPACPVVVVPAR